MNRRLRQQFGIKRLCLHARQLELKHPASGNKLSVQAPLPDDLRGLWKSLGFSA
jgi:23S rRNA-/tRNA-specific pseudouridylate synthase